MTDIIHALEQGDIDLMKTALTKGYDINTQNTDGDTALHIAIANDAEYEILKLLLENGASVTIKNKDGYTSLQMINPESQVTFLNLFRLERHINYEGGFGNTALHMLMLSSQTDQTFWQTIRDEFPNINFNVQNMIGQTPIHIASTETLVLILSFVLSNFKNLNLMIADERGDTFLHTFIRNVLDDSNDGAKSYCRFFKDLLEGQFQACSGEVLKQLLLSKNLTGHTPLHLIISECNYWNIDVLEKFITAGSPLNTTNAYGENILHDLLRHFHENVDLVNCFLKHIVISNGDMVNAQNGFGESPIFFSNDVHVLEILLEAGARLDLVNKVGKTPLMCRILEPIVDIEVIDLFLANGADVNTKDIHGNTVLHYAAWNNIDFQVVGLLKKYKTNFRVLDSLGQTPCQVAEKRGHGSLLPYICSCDPNEAQHLSTVRLDAIHIDLKDLHRLNSEITNIPEIQDRMQRFQPSCISTILDIPYFGSLMRQEDAVEVKEAVFGMMQAICEEIGRRDPMLCNTMIQSGSVGEETKVGLPDEFDFICTLDHFSSICEIDDAASNEDPGYAYLQLKTEFLGDDKYRHFFNASNYLNVGMIGQRIVRVLTDIIYQPGPMCHRNVIIDIFQYKSSEVKPNIQLFLRWTGAKYKDIRINIDLVPALRVKGWWPSNTNLKSIVGDVHSVQEGGAYLLFQPGIDDDGEIITNLRVSAFSAEKMHMASLPQLARDVYMVSKILCDGRVCPTVHMSHVSPSSILRTDMTSYMLKNCLFHFFNSENMSSMLSEIHDGNADVHSSSRKLYTITCLVFKRFMKAINEENLPSYIFPFQDIFTFQELPDFGENFHNHMKCTCMAVYVKLILTMLGDVQCFSDIDMDVLSDTVEESEPRKECILYERVPRSADEG